MSEPFAPTLVKAILAGWLIALMVWLLPSAQNAKMFVIISDVHCRRRPISSYHSRIGRERLRRDLGGRVGWHVFQQIPGPDAVGKCCRGRRNGGHLEPRAARARAQRDRVTRNLSGLTGIRR
jgi:hypothetical protein